VEYISFKTGTHDVWVLLSRGTIPKTFYPIDQTTDLDGRAQFYAPPRGYAVYAIR
jgi:hypothetical protein